MLLQPGPRGFSRISWPVRKVTPIRIWIQLWEANCLSFFFGMSNSKVSVGYRAIAALNASSDVEILTTEIQSSSRDQRQLKKKCLERDGNSCQITGYYDRDAATQLPPSELAGLPKVPTQAAHIVPFSCGSCTELDVSSNSF